MNTIKQGDIVIYDTISVGKVLDVYVTGTALVQFRYSTKIVDIKHLQKVTNLFDKGEKDA
jgi:hypothetical protein